MGRVLGALACVVVVSVLFYTGSRLSGCTSERRGIPSATLPASDTALGKKESASLQYVEDLGTNLDKKINALGFTPLTAAIFAGNTNLAQLLIQKGADLNARDAQGRTALMHAVGRGEGYTNVVRWLIENNADVNLKDHNGETALDHARASTSASPAVEAMLKRAGAKENLLSAVAKGDLLKTRMAMLDGADLDERYPSHDRTPLMVAINNGHDEIARLLIEAGAEVNATDREGMSALMYAIYKGDKNADLIKLLLERGADPNAKNKQGQTPLELAEYFRSARIEQMLAEATGVNQ